MVFLDSDGRVLKEGEVYIVRTGRLHVFYIIKLKAFSDKACDVLVLGQEFKGFELENNVPKPTTETPVEFDCLLKSNYTINNMDTFSEGIMFGDYYCYIIEQFINHPLISEKLAVNKLDLI